MTTRSQVVAKPSWFKVPLPAAGVWARFRSLLSDGCHTVCESAGCPNLGDCWTRGTASFLILGNRCTRNCAYCNVQHGKPVSPDCREEEKIVRIVSRLGLKYVVITSVTRDDLPDGGADSFRKVAAALAGEAGVGVEVLTPDFMGDRSAIAAVLAGKPCVFAHNLETVERLFPQVRPAGSYQRSLRVLQTVKEIAPGQRTKSGIMVGLGETIAELRTAIRDLRQAGVDIITIGQYLQPRRDLVEVRKFYSPGAFAELRQYAEEIGFSKVFSGPLVRSSYRAEEGLLFRGERRSRSGLSPTE